MGSAILPGSASASPACKELLNLLGLPLGLQKCSRERDPAPSSATGHWLHHSQELPAPGRRNVGWFWLQSLVLFQLGF